MNLFQLVGARLYQAALVGEAHCLYKVAQVQFGEHVGNVGLDRFIEMDYFEFVV